MAVRGKVGKERRMETRQENTRRRGRKDRETGVGRGEVLSLLFTIRHLSNLKQEIKARL